jgi:hypothetical protein
MNARDVRLVVELVLLGGAGGHAERRSGRRGSPSQSDDQVTDDGGLGEEWVVARVEFLDAGCPTGELALPVGGGAAVLRTDEVGRGHVVPGR